MKNKKNKNPIILLAITLVVIIISLSLYFILKPEAEVPLIIDQEYLGPNQNIPIFEPL